CVEDDLIARVRTGERVDHPSMVVYGVSKEEAARFGLPCGGTLRLLQEPLSDANWIAEVLERTGRQELVARTLDLDTGEATIEAARRGESFTFDGRFARQVFGPRYRILMIGAGQLSRVLAEMAKALDFQVYVCDPREEYYTTLALPQVTWL